MLVVLAHLGSCYLWGVMLPHFLKAFQCSTAVLAGSSSVGTIIAFLAAMSSGSVLKKFSPRTVLFFGTCVCAAFMLINAFATAPWMVYVFNGISGFIIAYGGHLTCTSIINRWFIKRRSTIIGIVVSGAVFGGSLYMFLAGQLIERVGQMNTYLILERNLSRVFFTKTFAVIYEFIFFNFLIKDRQTSVNLNFHVIKRT